jgi:putative heme transporter
MSARARAARAPRAPAAVLRPAPSAPTARIGVVPLFRRHRQDGAPAAETAAPAPHDVVRLDPQQLHGLFAAPAWLRDIGVMSWLLVGFGALLFALVWLAGQLQTILVPVILGGVLGAVAAPLVAWLERRGIPRLGGAVITLLIIIALAVGVLLLVLGGLTSEASTISSAMTKTLDRIENWLHDIGITKTEVKQHLQKDVPQAGDSLLGGVKSTLLHLASITTMLVFTAFSLLFILKDGPSMRQWIEGHIGLPRPIARIVTGNTLRALRQYFLGVTIVAAYNALLIGGGAAILGVPLAGTIAIVTFVGAYVPFIGAWIAGIFAVGLAISTGDSTDAIIMAVIALLANGVLQQLVQPIAFGATLSLNPLVVLISTISGGCLFGMIGLVLAAPLVSAGVSISKDIAAARLAEEAAAPPPTPPPMAPGEPAA